MRLGKPLFPTGNIAIEHMQGVDVADPMPEADVPPRFALLAAAQEQVALRETPGVYLLQVGMDRGDDRPVEVRALALGLHNVLMVEEGAARLAAVLVQLLRISAPL